MKNLKASLSLIVTLFIFHACVQNTKDAYLKMPKIDAHVHINTLDSTFLEFAKSQNFRYITLTTGAESTANIRKELGMALYQLKKYPKTIAVATTFTMENFETPAWQQEVLDQLDADFKAGAIAVKIWKDIGMVFRDSLGAFIMIDDPRFDPILDFIESKDKTLVGHLGEPRNCWLPLDSMTVTSDQNYFKEHPQYHMYLHPEYPSYEEQIAARDRMLEKHPGLRMVGAHLGSLEWNVDELAKRLDKFPNFAVDMAARICHFQVQNSEKVRNFIIKYQDRLLYGTDFVITDKFDARKRKEWLDEEWHNDWKYFSTDETMSAPAVPKPFKSLKLNHEVLKKIYYENALKWYPEAFKMK